MKTLLRPKAEKHERPACTATASLQLTMYMKTVTKSIETFVLTAYIM